jgi:hypothetical protein
MDSIVEATLGKGQLRVRAGRRGPSSLARQTPDPPIGLDHGLVLTRPDSRATFGQALEFERQYPARRRATHVNRARAALAASEYTHGGNTLPGEALDVDAGADRVGRSAPHSEDFA